MPASGCVWSAGSTSAPNDSPSASTNAAASRGKSLGSMPTTRPALALRSLRLYWLMPLVTTRPGSLVAATTVPPGHMQKL